MKKILWWRLLEIDPFGLGGRDKRQRQGCLHGNDGHGKRGRLQTASRVEAGQHCKSIGSLSDLVALALAERRVKVALAAAGAILVGDGNVDEGANKGNVEDDGQKGGEGLPREAAENQQGDDCVEDGGAGDAGDGADGVGDVEVVVGEGGEEVAVDAEDDGCAEELHAAVEPLEELEGEARSCAHGGGGGDDDDGGGSCWLSTSVGLNSSLGVRSTGV